MQQRSFTADLILGLIGLALIFAALIYVSYFIARSNPALGPVIANSLWFAALLGLAVAGVRARRYGRAVAPLVFVALWAAGSQIHAGILSAQSGPRDGLTHVADVRPVWRLIVNASYGLPVDPSRTGGVSMAPFDECGAWCRDLILEKGLGAIVLWTPKPDAPTARTQFRQGRGDECGQGATATATCLVEEPVEAFPDGVMIEMGDEAGPSPASALCCPIVIVSRIEGGQKTVIKSYRQGQNLSIMPVPIITATGPPFAETPVMMSHTPLGPPLRFDTLIEALLDTQLKWK